ncbi:MAG: hypothetical protein IJ240_07245 [Clostridia bacterium]|nr:hypothetical protein [Clostridia bacterium]
MFDGKYVYDGFTEALQPDGRAFDRTLITQTTRDCYIYFEVPQSVINRYQTCVVKIGMTNDYGTIIKWTKDGSYDFDVCAEVYEVKLTK